MQESRFSEILPFCLAILAMNTCSCNDAGVSADDRKAWIQSAKINDKFIAIAISNEDELAGVTKDGQLRLFSTKDGALISELNTGLSRCHDVKYSPNGKYLFILGISPSTALIQRTPLELVSAVRQEGTYASSAAWGPNSDRLLTCEFDGVKVRRIPDLNVLVEIRGHHGEIPIAVWSPDGREIATGGYDATVRLWSQNGKPIAVMRGHPDRVFSLTYSSDGSLLASGGIRTVTDRRNVYVRDVESRELVFRCGHAEDVEMLRFSHTSDDLFVYTEHSVAKWNIESKELKYRVDRDVDPMYPDAQSPNGRLIGTLGYENGASFVAIWKREVGGKKEPR